MIELLITIGVIGVLASVLLVIINPFTQLQRTRDVKRKTELTQVQRALEQYYQDNGRYPCNTGSAGCPGATQYRIFYNGQMANWGSTLFSPYMARLPQDPLPASKFYVYFSPLGNQSYYLYASLDRGVDDPQACSGGGACPGISSNGINADACGGASAVCNFGVTSPNTTP